MSDNWCATFGRKVTRCVVPTVLSRQLLQQRLRVLEVGGVKALGEPAVDRRQQLLGLRPFALLLPQPAQAQRGAEFVGFGLLLLGNGQGLAQARFGVSLLVSACPSAAGNLPECGRVLRRRPTARPGVPRRRPPPAPCGQRRTGRCTRRARPGAPASGTDRSSPRWPGAWQAPAVPGQCLPPSGLAPPGPSHDTWSPGCASRAPPARSPASMMASAHCCTAGPLRQCWCSRAALFMLNSRLTGWASSRARCTTVSSWANA